MVHYWNYENGIQDCSRGGTYHNKRFKEAAEARDLCIEHDARYGWTITSPADGLLDFILQNGLTDILLNRNEASGFQITGTGTHSGNTNGAPPKPSSTRKYICPCCGMSVRATKEVRIMCIKLIQTCKKDVSKQTESRKKVDSFLRRFCSLIALFCCKMLHLTRGEIVKK